MKHTESQNFTKSSHSTLHTHKCSCMLCNMSFPDICAHDLSSSKYTSVEMRQYIKSRVRCFAVLIATIYDLSYTIASMANLNLLYYFIRFTLSRPSVKVNFLTCKRIPAQSTKLCPQRRQCYSVIYILTKMQYNNNCMYCQSGRKE